MAGKQEIAFGLKVEGVEQTIKSVKDLKSAIKSLQDEAEGADIGSEQYKNAIENIEKLNDKLKEVTQTEKQAAKASEDLANAQQEAAKETGDLRKQFEKLEDELFMLAGQGKQNTKEFRDLANEAAVLNKKIEQVNQSLEGGAATKSAEGFQMLSGGLTSVKDGLLELDFGKVKDGLMQAKQGFMMFGQGAKTALQGVKGALIATGIGALVVALGLIVAYWDDIKGLVSGVSSEQKKLNEDSAANLQLQQDKVAAISAQENILKLQGKSEREILQLKIKQTDEAITASDIAIQQAENTKKAQVDAAQRNKNILQGIIAFVTAPITALLYGIDLAGKAFGQDFGLAEGFTGGLAKMVFNPEDVATEGDKVIAEAKAVNDKLKNDRAGLQLSVNKIDGDARKEASEKAKAAAEEAKKLRDAAAEANKKAKDDLIAYNRAADIENQKIDNADALTRATLKVEKNKDDIDAQINLLNVQKSIELQNKELTTKEIELIEQKHLTNIQNLKKAAEDKQKALDAKTLTDKNTENTAAAELAVLQEGNELQDLINQLSVNRDIELQNKELTASQKLLIDEKYNQDVAAIKKAADDKALAIEQATEDARYQIAQNSVSSLQNLSDIYFLFKTKNLEKGSKAELEAAKKQFNVNKALQIASATIAGVQGVMNALSAQSVLPEPAATILRVATAVGVGIAAAANIAKIASTKFEGGGGGATGGGGGAAPMPSIPAPPTIATSNNNTNQTTSFDENGKNLDFKQPQINVTATVGVDEIAKKSNRVEVLEQQSTF